MLAPFATVIGSDAFQQGINDLIQQTQEITLPFGIRLFDVLILLAVFLIANKILGGKLIDAIKEKLASKPAAPDVPVANAAAAQQKPGVEDVNNVLVAAGVPQADADAFVKANWEAIRGLPAKPVAPAKV